MPKRRSLFTSVSFNVVMSIISLVMVAEYTRLVLTVDDSTRRIVVLFVWLAMAFYWISRSIVRFRANRRRAPER